MPSCLISLLVCAAGGPAAAEETIHVDVAVYGGTASGTVAAIAAANEGASVILLEPRRHIGGMVSGGLGASDIGRAYVVGGMSRAFFQRVGQHYDREIAWQFEPHVAEEVFRDWLAEADVKVRFEQPLRNVVVRDGMIRHIVTGDGTKIEADVYIDATYEGDLMAAAGVRYTWGREGRDVYGESLAGRLAKSPKHQFHVDIPARRENGKLWPTVSKSPPGAVGSGDRRVQAYNFRLCLSDDPANQVPFPRPPGYNADRYALLGAYLNKRGTEIGLGDIMHVQSMPNGKTDINNNGPFSSDHIGGSADYPDADPQRRQEIWRDHVHYVQGWLYFLVHDPSVPPHIQNELRRYGLAKDEFVDNDHWPHQLYVREARRMIGAYVMTQRDLQEQRTKPDAIGMGSYNIDSHHVQRYVDDNGFVRNEGDMQIPVEPYAISYRAITPRAAECTNLLVPVCVSASHAAYSSIRMEPVYMILGQSAGTAAALAVREKTTVQDVSYDGLRKRLLEHGQVLSLDHAIVRYMRASDLAGIVVDDRDAERRGQWTVSGSEGPYINQGYLHDGNTAKGEASLVFTPDLPHAGRYTVSLAYTSHGNRDERVPIVINTVEGRETIHVNQQTQPSRSPFQPLGVFELAAGKQATVTVSNEGTSGYVIADAVQWLPVKE